jgi:transposase
LVLDRAKILKLDDDGLSIREIAALVDVSRASIHRVLKAHRPSGGSLIPV